VRSLRSESLQLLYITLSIEFLPQKKNILVKSEVITSVTMRAAVSSDTTLRSFVDTAVSEKPAASNFTVSLVD
jgi:hypothetical protein